MARKPVIQKKRKSIDKVSVLKVNLQESDLIMTPCELKTPIKKEPQPPTPFDTSPSE
jgi:hypothetical protein